MNKIIKIAALLFLASCSSQSPTASATEAAICDAWGQSLPTRSRSDTQATIDQITGLYATFAAACPAHRALIP